MTCWMCSCILITGIG